MSAPRGPNVNPSQAKPSVCVQFTVPFYDRYSNPSANKGTHDALEAQSNKKQAEQILEQAMREIANGADEFAITYSANEYQTGALSRNDCTLDDTTIGAIKGGTGQALVLEQIYDLLKNKYPELKNKFKVIPITTISHNENKALNRTPEDYHLGLITKDMARIDNYMAKPNRRLWIWQNQYTVNDPNHPFAHGGGAARGILTKVVDDKIQDESILRFNLYTPQNVKKLAPRATKNSANAPATKPPLSSTTGMLSSLPPGPAVSERKELPPLQSQTARQQELQSRSPAAVPTKKTEEENKSTLTSEAKINFHDVLEKIKNKPGMQCIQNSEKNEILVTIEGNKTDSFSIFPEKFETVSNSQKVFEAMLETFKTAAPTQSPKIDAPDEKTLALWKNAFEKVYQNSSIQPVYLLQGKEPPLTQSLQASISPRP